MPAENSSEKDSHGRRHHRPRRNKIQKSVIGISAFINAYRDEQKANRKQDAREDRVKRNIEIATLLFVVLTTAGIFYQARILNSSDEAIHDSADAAKDAANAAKAAIETTKTIMQIDQRAWIGIESVDPVPVFPEVGKSFGTKGAIRNTGKTPARNIEIYSIIEPVDAGKRPNFSYVGIQKVSGGYLSPNGKGVLPLIELLDSKHEHPAIFTQQLLDLLNNRQGNIYTHGRIEYDDIFGIHHWMTYCSYLPVPSIGGFAFCAEHNESDDYQETKK